MKRSRQDELYNELVYLPLDKLYVGDLNVRKHKRSAGVAELAKSIEEVGGVLQPVVVKPVDERYEIIVGQRRFNAAQQLGLKRIPALIIERPLENLTAKLISLIENVHRRDLPFKDTVEVISDLFEKHGRNAKRVAQVTSLSVPTIYKYLGLAAAPEELKVMVDRKEISQEDAQKAMKIGKGDVNKTVRVAKYMPTLARPEKVNMVQLAEENPTAGPDKLAEEARKPRTEFDIMIKLPSSYYLALRAAAKDRDMDEVTLATEAVMDWLVDEGLVD